MKALQTLVDQVADGEDVRQFRDVLLPAVLFRRTEAGAAAAGPGQNVEPFGGRVGGHMPVVDEPQVDQGRFSALPADVLRLDVLVDNPLLVEIRDHVEQAQQEIGQGRFVVPVVEHRNVIDLERPKVFHHIVRTPPVDARAVAARQLRMVK